jgi:hypothetical protein
MRRIDRRSTSSACERAIWQITCPVVGRDVVEIAALGGRHPLAANEILIAAAQRNLALGPHVDRVLRVAGRELSVGAAETSMAPTVDVSWRRCLHDFKLDPARDYRPTDARLRGACRDSARRARRAGRRSPAPKWTPSTSRSPAPATRLLLADVEGHHSLRESRSRC